MWCTWLKMLECRLLILALVSWPHLASTPIAVPPTPHWLLVTHRRTGAPWLSASKLLLCYFLSWGCSYPSCPPHELLLILRGPGQMFHPVKPSPTFQTMSQLHTPVRTASTSLVTLGCSYPGVPSALRSLKAETSGPVLSTLRAWHGASPRWALTVPGPAACLIPIHHLPCVLGKPSLSSSSSSSPALSPKETEPRNQHGGFILKPLLTFMAIHSFPFSRYRW